MEIKKTIIEKYELREPNGHCDNSRIATIVFENNVFIECVYVGLDKTYTLEDWKFLRKVAEEIERIVGVAGQTYNEIVMGAKSRSGVDY